MTDTQFEGPRPARIDEREAILETANYVGVSVGRSPSIAEDYPQVYAPDNLQNVFVVKAGDKIAATTGVWANDIQVGNFELRVGGINGVGTLPEFRRRGLGGRILQSAHDHMRALGCHVGLLSTTIFDWYRSMGWERACVQRQYHFNRSNIQLLPPLPDDVKMELVGTSEVEEVLSLHHADQLGARRTPEGFCQLLQAKRNPQLLVARQDGQSLAYLIGKGHGVMEWGGRADLIAGLVRAWFQQLDEPEASTSDRDADRLQGLTVQAFGAAHPFVSLLDERRIPCDLSHASMMLVVDPRGVLDAFGHNAIEIAQKGEVFQLTMGNNIERFTRSELAKLFFGPERISSFGRNTFPFPFWHWPLEHV